MKCDSTHACIERKSKALMFSLPTDFEKAKKEAPDNPFPFVVEHLTHIFFRNYDDQDYLMLKSIRPGNVFIDILLSYFLTYFRIHR